MDTGAGVQTRLSEGQARESGSSRKHVLLLAILGLLCSWPLLWNGAPDLSHDAIHHARWARNFATQFWGGDLYPRWLSGTNGGLGSPMFFFYPPVSFWVAAIFQPVVSAFDPYGWRIVGISNVAAVILSGLACYAWLRLLANGRAALAGAAIYVILPYHIAIDLYNRGAFGEVWAFVWMPVILAGVHGLLQQRKWAFVVLALSYGLLIYTHLAITLAFSLVPPFAALLMSPRRRAIRNAFLTSVAMLLGIGIGCSFLLPSMVEQRHAWLEMQLSDWFFWGNWFIFQRPPSLLDYKSRMLYISISTLVFGLVLAWLSWRRGARETAAESQQNAVWFYTGVAVVSFLMMTQLSTPVWQHTPYLQFLQFPSRFNTILCIPVAALTAISFAALLRAQWTVKVFLALIAVSWLGANAWAGATAFSAWREIPADRAASYRKETELQREYFSFWPKPARVTAYNDLAALETFLRDNPPGSAVLMKENGSSQGSVTLTEHRPRKFVFDVTAPEKGQLTVRHFYYPGWTAHGDGFSQPARPSAPDGFIQFDVPAGEYALDIELEMRPAELTGTWISLVCLAITGVLGVRAVRRT